jgi:hypothetical protein
MAILKSDKKVGQGGWRCRFCPKLLTTHGRLARHERTRHGVR